MRILMLSHGYPPTVSGVTLVVQKLSRALVRRGHSVAVVSGSDRGQAYQVDDQGVQVIRIRSLVNPFWSEGPIPWASQKGLREIIEGFQPDLIHTHENAVLSYQLLRLDREPRVPWVSSCYYLPRYVNNYLHIGSQVDQWIEDRIWQYAIHNLNQFDHVVFSTQTQQQEFIAHGLRVPSRAISNGVDTRRYFPRNGRVEEVEARYTLPPRPRILFVGRLMKDKKIDLLIQAMAQVCAEREAHLLVVGRGDEQPELEALTAQLELQPYVHLLGYVPEADLPALYRASDLFAIASICEVQSIPALQAIATGLPIVAVNAAALPELVRPGENGYLVPPDDPEALAAALLRIAGDPEHAAELGQASLELVPEHREVETFRAYERFYEELLAARTPV